jgi:hypothetical protein
MHAPVAAGSPEDEGDEVMADEEASEHEFDPNNEFEIDFEIALAMSKAMMQQPSRSKTKVHQDPQASHRLLPLEILYSRASH